MLYIKPPYVAICQRKEVKCMYMQAHFSHPIPTLSGPRGASVIGEYPAIYYPTTSFVVPRQGVMHPRNLRQSGWWPSSGLAPPQRHVFQHMQLAAVRIHLLNWNYRI